MTNYHGEHHQRDSVTRMPLSDIFNRNLAMVNLINLIVPSREMDLSGGLSCFMERPGVDRIGFDGRKRWVEKQLIVLPDKARFYISTSVS